MDLCIRCGTCVEFYIYGFGKLKLTPIDQAAYLLWSSLQAQHSFFQTHTPASVFVDFLLNIGALLLAVTVYSLMPSLLLSLLLAPATLILALPPSIVPPTRPAVPRKLDSGGTKDMTPFPRRPFLTVYRGGMMVITCLSILAVDFHIFPRRFAKVETWGTSLMDVGVGSFVFSAGLVASKAHLKARLHAEQPDSHNSQSHPELSFLARVFQSLRHSLPLLALGIIRLISVKNLAYAEHVSEYGVHWNFFFTLAFLPLFLSLLHPILSHPRLTHLPVHGSLGLMLSLTIELVLNTTSLKQWALTAPRTSLLSANKEGLVSLPGYLAIFLLGMETGSLVLPRFTHPTPPLSQTLKLFRLNPASASPRNVLLASLSLSCAFFSAALALFLYAPSLHLNPWLSIPVSRRLANLPYVVWISAFNTGQLLLFALVESFVFPAVFKARDTEAEEAAVRVATPEVLGDFNGGGLVLFGIANLMTGGVNLGVDTLETGNVEAVGVLLVYMASLRGIAAGARRLGLRL